MNLLASGRRPRFAEVSETAWAITALPRKPIGQPHCTGYSFLPFLRTEGIAMKPFQRLPARSTWQ